MLESNSCREFHSTNDPAILCRLDDIEDGSPLRRGQPATHTVFGQALTINSANFVLIQAMDQVRLLEDSRCLDIFVEETRNLFIGQSFDLYWTRQDECPSEEEYLEMIRQSSTHFSPSQTFLSQILC